MKTIITSKKWLQNRESIKKSIPLIIAYWKHPLGMMHWTLDISYREQQFQASCVIEPKYFKAKLYFNFGRIEKELHTNFDLEELVVHEMCHCKTFPLSSMAARLIMYVGDESGELDEQADIHDEQLVTCMGQALMMAKYRLTLLPDSVTLRSWDDMVYTEDPFENE